LHFGYISAKVFSISMTNVISGAVKRLAWQVECEPSTAFPAYLSSFDTQVAANPDQRHETKRNLLPQLFRACPNLSTKQHFLSAAQLEISFFRLLFQPFPIYTIELRGELRAERMEFRILQEIFFVFHVAFFSLCAEHD
jgi:hypothetical protein